MPRSLIREEQIVDEDVLSEAEHGVEPHYFKDLGDVTTYSGYAGKYVRANSDNSGLNYGTPTSSGGDWIDSFAQIERGFYHGTTDPTIGGVPEGSLYFKHTAVGDSPEQPPSQYTDVITVGTTGPPTYDYDNIDGACSAAPDGALILVYPGTYTNDKINDYGKTLYIRGMGTLDTTFPRDNDPVEYARVYNTTEHIVDMQGSTSNELTLTIENMALYQASNSYHCIIYLRGVQNSNATLNINKCLLDNYNSSYGIMMGNVTVGSVPYGGEFYLTNCDWGGNSGATLWYFRQAYNGPFEVTGLIKDDTFTKGTNEYNPMDLPDVLDYVTTTTSGYGIDYGDDLITVPDGY